MQVSRINIWYELHDQPLNLVSCIDIVMTQTTNLSLGNEPTGVAFPSDPVNHFDKGKYQGDNEPIILF